MRSSAALAALFFLMAAGDVRAQPTGTTPPPRKSPAKALLRSLGVTAAGGLVIAGASAAEIGEVAVLGGVVMFIGPSVGRWYGGAREGTLIGMGVRVVALGVAWRGLDEDNQPIDGCDPELDDCTAHDANEAEHDRKARRLYIAAAALWIGSSVYDIVMAPLDAREFNREHAVTVAPTLLRGGGQGGAALVPGLALSGRF